MKVRRIVWTDVGRMEFEEVELGPPGPGQMQVSTLVTLLSPGTERAWFLGLPNTPAKFPARPGYNQVGQVTAVGPDVTAFAAGDRVVSTAGHGTGAAGPAVVIGATGGPERVRQALEIGGRGGRVVLLGSTRGSSDGVNWYKDIHCRGLQVLGAHANARPAQDRSAGHWSLQQDGDA